MPTIRLRRRLVFGSAVLLAAAFAVRFCESPLAAWSAAQADGTPRWDVGLLTIVVSGAPTVLQIVALSLASAALLDARPRVLRYVPLFWAALQVLFAWLGAPGPKSWAAAHVASPVWRLWAELSAGQVSALSHGFGARQVVAALLGAAIASACLNTLPVDSVTASPSGEDLWHPQESS